MSEVETSVDWLFNIESCDQYGAIKLPLTVGYIESGDFGANNLSLRTKVVGRRHFHKLQDSHEAKTVLSVVQFFRFNYFRRVSFYFLFRTSNAIIRASSSSCDASTIMSGITPSCSQPLFVKGSTIIPTGTVNTN